MRSGVSPVIAATVRNGKASWVGDRFELSRVSSVFSTFRAHSSRLTSTVPSAQPDVRSSNRCASVPRSRLRMRGHPGIDPFPLRIEPLDAVLRGRRDVRARHPPEAQPNRAANQLATPDVVQAGGPFEPDVGQKRHIDVRARLE